MVAGEVLPATGKGERGWPFNVVLMTSCCSGKISEKSFGGNQRNIMLSLRCDLEA